MPFRRGAVACAFAFAMLAACTSLNGLSGDSSDAGADGGSVVPPNAQDGATGDAGNDGAVDTPFSCADHAGATFCADFDMPPVDLGWTSTIIAPDDAGTIERDTATSTSPPASMHASVATHASANFYVVLERVLFGAGSGSKQASSVHVEVALKLGRLPDQGESYTLFYLCAHTTALGCGGAGALSLSMNHQGLQVLEDTRLDGGEQTYPHSLSYPAIPKIGDWFHVVLDVDTATLALSVDGVAKLAPGETSHFSAYASDPRLDLGLFYVGPYAAFDAWFDDLLVIAK